MTDEELEKRLRRLRGNDEDDGQEELSKFARIQGREVPEHFFNWSLNQRQREIINLKKEAKGNVRRKRSSIEPHLKFRLPETPPAIPEDPYWEGVATEWIPNNLPLSGPPPFKYDEKDFPPLSRPPSHLPPIQSATTSFYSNPLPPIPSDTPQSISPLRNKLPSIDPFPSLPNINDFSRPITELVDERDNTIEITPKKIDLPPIGQKQLSKELNQLFPDVDATIKEKEDSFKERTENIVDLIERVGENEKSQLTFQFEFFQDGENVKFDSIMNNFGLTSENKKFIEFLQSEYCRKILENDSLKIYIETGNNYYKDRDTSESIFHFIQNQKNVTKGVIKQDFKFSGNYKEYFQWILNQFDAHEKTNYHLLNFQNIKLLVYRYNDILLSGGNEIIKIRHSQLTNDYLAAAEIQNQDWQYFIERILEVSNEPNSINPQETFLKNNIENITVAKQVYKMMFNTVATNFNLTIPELNSKKIKDISEHFYLKNYSYSQSLTNLDNWVSYYYNYGKFPGSNELISIPYSKNPYFLKTNEHLSPATLHQKFYNSDLLGLSSFQALCALNIYLGGSKEISGLAYSEFLQNMTYQALSQENDSIQLAFDQCVDLGHSIVNTLNEIVTEESEYSSYVSDRVNDALDVTFKIQQDETEKFIEDKVPLRTSTPLSKKEINDMYEKEKEDYLKVAMQINAEDLDAAAERAKIENEKLYQEIVNPNPGLVIDNKIDLDDKLNENNLSNATQKHLTKTLEEAKEKMNASYFSAPIIDITPNDTNSNEKNDIEDIYIDNSPKSLTKTIHFPQPSTNDRKDFELKLKDEQMIIFDSPFLETSISIERKDLNNILENIAEDLDSNLQTLDMNESEKINTKQKKVIVKNIIQKLDKTPNKNIEKQLKSQKWLQSLVDDQLRIDNMYTFGNYLENTQKNKFKNVTKRRKKISPITWIESEEPSIDKLLPTNKRKSIESAKKIFSNIIKNVPPESYKKFKIEYSPQEDLNLMDEDEF